MALQVLRSLVAVREAVAGEKDTRRLIAEGNTLAALLAVGARDQLVRSSREADDLANQLAALTKKGLVCI